MKIFNNYKSISNFTNNSTLVIGNFDGVHKGHQKIIKIAKSFSKKYKSKLGVMMFDPHPKEFFAKSSPHFLLSSVETKCEILKELKVDYVIILRFNKSLSSMSAPDFCKKILLLGVKMKHVFIGKNFKFGKKRKGDYSFLKKFGVHNKFKVSSIKLFHRKAKNKIDSKLNTYSSTNIRRLIRDGNVAMASKYLGQYWFITGKVIVGDKRGRTIGFPTANIRIDDYMYPKFGVYAVKVNVLNKNNQSREYLGIANFGIRPTFDKKSPILEVHLFNFKLNIYNSTLKVTFIDFIRFEKKFSGIEALKKQVKSDISKAIKILR
jgi:riboflavin kinase/FMN adenylyltransferase